MEKSTGMAPVCTDKRYSQAVAEADRLNKQEF